MTDAPQTVSIAKRFCGPQTSGNGGYCAGLFAQIIDGPAATTLKAPPPLDRPIELRAVGDNAYGAFAGDIEIAGMKPAAVEIDPPALPDESVVAAAHEAYLAEIAPSHLFPGCFVCGPRRAEGDGLRIFSGPAPDSPVNADFWTPTADLADEDGLVRPEFLWAALDCPTYFALRLKDRFMLLGRMAVEVKARPKAGERLIVAAWPTGHEGRKFTASSALYDADRNLIAAANATWIEIANPEMLQKLRAENE